MCLTPITLKKPRRFTHSVRPTSTVPCGKCGVCLRRRANDWTFRLYQEQKRSESAIFLTLTYDDDNLPLKTVTNHYVNYQTGEIIEYEHLDTPVLDKTDFQKFMKRLRKKLRKHGNIRLKYYAVGEYGTLTSRPHYHAILFNMPLALAKNIEFFDNTWQKGLCHIGDSTISSIRYVCKYIMKGRPSKNTDKPPEFSLMSKGMGANYLTPQMVKYHEQLIDHVRLPNGETLPLPRYYREKLFNDLEKHKIRVNSIINQVKFENKHFTTKTKDTWKIDQIRKHQKSVQLERQKL